MMKCKKFVTLALVSYVLVALQLALILVSWIISSVAPSLHVKSLISAEGVRWLFSNFTSFMSGPLLVWLLVCSIAYGAFISSGLCRAVKSLFRGGQISYRRRHALFAVLFVLLVVSVVVILLSFVPHAILLGVIGSLYPGAFSLGFVPMLAFVLTLISVVYGVVSGSLVGYKMIFKSLYSGLYISAPLFPVYIFSVQLYHSVKFVFF